MKRYDNYKDSGVAWLGEVPSHWEVKRMKYLSSFNPTNKRAISDNDDVSYAPMNHVRWNSIEPNIIKWGLKPTGLNYFENGDVLMAKVTPCFENGNIAIAQNLTNGCGVCSSELFVFRPTQVNNCFLFYCLQHAELKREFIASMRGTGGLKRIEPEVIYNYFLPVPPLAEQEAIAAYLDAKCEAIDGMVEKIEEKISLFQRLRRAIITRAVTRGLNPDAPLRSSGVDWIGEVPEHWEVNKVSRVCKTGSGTTPSSSNEEFYTEENGYNWLQTGDLNDGEIIRTSKQITEKALSSCSALKFFPIGSIVVAMYGATIGKVGMLKIETTTNQACCVLTPNEDVKTKFLYYTMLCGKEPLILDARGGGQPNISQEKIRQLQIPVPPLAEQQAIADYLDRKCSKIDELVAKYEKQKELLARYKKSLIAQVVTGQRRVC